MKTLESVLHYTNQPYSQIKDFTYIHPYIIFERLRFANSQLTLFSNILYVQDKRISHTRVSYNNKADKHKFVIFYLALKKVIFLLYLHSV